VIAYGLVEMLRPLSRSLTISSASWSRRR